jgi:hypothetical protein
MGFQRLGWGRVGVKVVGNPPKTYKKFTKFGEKCGKCLECKLHLQ